MLENRFSRKRVLWNLLLLFPVLLVCLFTACGEEADPLDDYPPITVTPDTVKVDAQALSQYKIAVKLKEPSDFLATCNQDWVILRDAEGSGQSSYEILASVKTNYTADIRTAKVTINSGELTDYAYIKQFPFEELTVEFQRDTFSLPADLGNRGQFIVQTNKSCKYTASAPEWCKFEEVRNHEERHYVFELTVLEENRGEDRTGYFTFTAGGKDHQMCIIQRGKNIAEDTNEYKITINPNSCNFTNKGGLSDFEVIVDKETTISIESNADWCTISDNYGESYYNTPSTAFKMAIKAAENIGESRTATVTVRAGKSTATCTITQDAYVTGENKIGGTIADAVDLGLSVKWASHNLGASKETEAGAYLFWGYLEESEYYNEENYRYYDNTNEKYLEVATNICGTKYDAAFHHWGNNWRMPTKAECDELLKKCTWEWVRINNTNGYRVTGPNGKHIFLPAWGYQLGKYNKNKENKEVIIWSGESTSADNRYAYTIKGRSDEKERQQHERIFGLNIRPVK